MHPGASLQPCPRSAFAVAQVQAVLQQKEEEDRQMRQLVQALQTALESEKLLVHGLREQVRAAPPPSRSRLHHAHVHSAP